MHSFDCEDRLISISIYPLVQQTSLPPAAQAPGSGSLAGVVVGACIGTALLYTVVLLVVIFALVLWSRRHRSVSLHLWYSKVCGFW